MVSHLIQEYLRPGCCAHLVGIGGVSMSPLAEVLCGVGLVVTGSDMQRSPTVERLETLGITVTIGHLPESVQGADCVIRTAAVHDDNPEIAAARAAGIPVFERAQAWGALMRQYQNALCVSGTHGKTTTTSMCTHIFMAAQADPTVMIGGHLPLLGASHRVGKGDTVIMESCEYCDSFLSFFPTVAVILNVEADHLDYFADLSAVQRSFRAFADLVPANGWVVANGEDVNTIQALSGHKGNMVTFGVKTGDIHAENLVFTNGFAEFDIIAKGGLYTHAALQVPGTHNVKNALAAAAAAYVMGIPAATVAEGLGSFTGAGRRFEFKGEYNGARVYDDYAHHPSEVEALLTAVRPLGYNRIVCAFQPHTYTRTHELFDDFCRVLKLADVTLLGEIYAAREKNTIGISSRNLLPHIPGATYHETLEDLTDALASIAQPGDLILTVGAGSIYTVGEALVQRK